MQIDLRRLRASPSPIVAAAAIVLGCAVPARAAPAHTIADISARFQTCFGGVRLAAGTDVTVLFMLNRRGGIIGKPRITHAKWVGDETDHKSSAASIAQGFDRCLPIEISDGLGGAIAGRLFTYRFYTPAARQDKV